MRRLLLVGAGGHGRVVADLAEAAGWQEVAFVDDSRPGRPRNLDWPIVAAASDLEPLRERFSHALAAIGDNRRRLEVNRHLVALGFTVPVLVHPSAIISRHAAIGAGTVIMANAVVNAAARVGEGVILNTACTVDHDCSIEDGTHVSPGANLAGGVHVGEASWIGIGASVREGIRIGNEVIIGAGAAVVGDVPAGATVGGVPAMALKLAKDRC